MKKTTIAVNGESVECKELTVGQMREAKKLMKEDEFLAGLLMVKMSTGRDDKWIDTCVMSELAPIGEWLGNPTE